MPFLAPIVPAMNVRNKRKPIFEWTVCMLFVLGVGTAAAQTTAPRDTNYVSAYEADSTIAAIESKLDKSGYGFYSISCSDGFMLNYRLLKPPTVPNIRYPLVFTLPGSGAEGTDNVKQMGGVGPSIWGQKEYQAIHPHYSVVPQRSALLPDSNWKTLTAFEYKELRDTLIKSYPDIDTNRIYLTGHSAGGSMVYRMLGIFPGVFAAGMPCDGAIGGAHEGYGPMGIWPDVYVSTNTPVHMFNGGYNDAVKPDQINGMFNIADSITVHGGNPITTYMPNLNHSEMEGMYKLEKGLFEWLFAQHRDLNTAVSSIPVNPSLSLYPNPATNAFIIRTAGNSKDVHYSLFNLLGQELMAGRCSTGIIQVDVGALKRGMYLVHLSSGTSVEFRNLIKK